MVLARCQATLRASSLTIAGALPLTSGFCNSARTPRSKTCHRTSGPHWGRLHDSVGSHHGADRTMATKLAVCVHRRSAAGHHGVPARPSTVPPLLSLCLSLLDRHGARMPGHLAAAPCSRREVGDADPAAMRGRRSNAALHGSAPGSSFTRHAYSIRLGAARGGARCQHSEQSGIPERSIFYRPRRHLLCHLVLVLASAKQMVG